MELQAGRWVAVLYQAAGYGVWPHRMAGPCAVCRVEMKEEGRTAGRRKSQAEGEGQERILWFWHSESQMVYRKG